MDKMQQIIELVEELNDFQLKALPQYLQDFLHPCTCSKLELPIPTPEEETQIELLREQILFAEMLLEEIETFISNLYCEEKKLRLKDLKAFERIIKNSKFKY